VVRIRHLVVGLVLLGLALLPAPALAQSGTVIPVSSSATVTWGDIAGKPTTVSGFGLTDAVATGSSYSNPAWLTSLAWSKLTGTPTTISGYGLTDAASLSSANTLSMSGAASTPGMRYTGNLYTGGSTSTNMPFAYWDGSTCSGGAATAPTGATNGFNTSGTLFGINVCSGMTFDAVTLLSAWHNGVRRFNIFGDRLTWYTTNGGSAGSVVYDYLSSQFYFDRSVYATGGLVGFWNTGTGIKSAFRYEADGQVRGWSCSSPNSCSTTLQMVHADLPTAGGNSGTGTKTLTLNTSNYWSYTVTGAFTLAFSNPTAGQTFTIVLTIDGTGGYGQPTWPTMKWDGGAAPTLNMTAGKVNVIAVTYDGSNYIGKATVIGG
jgi:hypothetical protein